jgi:hypothetical protein
MHVAGVNLAKTTGHFDVINSAFLTKNNAHLCGAVWTIAHLCQSQLGSEIVRENEWIQKVIHVVQTHHNYLVRGVALSALGLASSSNFVRYDSDCANFERMYSVASSNFLSEVAWSCTSNFTAIPWDLNALFKSYHRPHHSTEVSLQLVICTRHLICT